MINRSAQIRRIISDVKKQIHIPNHIEYEAALEAQDERLIGLFDESFADELFSAGVLNMNILKNAHTLAEMTHIIDNFISIITFYNDNHKRFSSIIEDPVFKQLLLEKGILHSWNEVMNHSYKTLSSFQVKILVFDALTRLHGNEERVRMHAL